MDEDEKHKIPMCNSPFMRYAGDVGELEEFSCALETCTPMQSE